MRKLILSAMLALAPVAAHAGSVTISVTNAANGTVSKTFTVPDAHIARWIATYQSDANTSVNAVATRNQVLNYIAVTTMQGWVSATQAFEAAAAAAAATAGVAPITAN